MCVSIGMELGVLLGKRATKCFTKIILQKTLNSLEELHRHWGIFTYGDAFITGIHAKHQSNHTHYFIAKKDA